MNCRRLDKWIINAWLAKDSPRLLSYVDQVPRSKHVLIFKHSILLPDALNRSPELGTIRCSSLSLSALYGTGLFSYRRADTRNRFTWVTHILVLDSTICITLWPFWLIFLFCLHSSDLSCTIGLGVRRNRSVTSVFVTWLVRIYLLKARHLVPAPFCLTKVRIRASYDL